MTLTPFVVIWSVMAVAVVGLAIARNVAGLHEDDNLHLVDSEQGMISKQLAFHGFVDRIEKWGITLTIVTVVTGLALGIVYLYQLAQAYNRLS
ncbi:MAG: hypothetical protein KGN84_07560 [Acidobacteriota bacterium]|nr:hypothetical protein [Acidobacteriota bacterium]